MSPNGQQADSAEVLAAAERLANPNAKPDYWETYGNRKERRGHLTNDERPEHERRRPRRS